MELWDALTRLDFDRFLRAAADLDSSGYYALGIPAYLLLLFGERWLARLRGLPRTPFGRAIGNISAGLGALVVGLFLAPLLIGLYLWGFDHLALVRWAPGSWVPWVLAFLLGDFGYYLNHRAGHRFGLLWTIHGVHHQCDSLDFTVAMRHPWLSDLSAIPFYAALPLAGVPPGHFFLAISVISFYAFFVHTRVYDFPSLGFLVTPGSHIAHHAKNPRYMGKNLGAMFSLWDRLFGTFVVVDPAEPPVLGTPDGYRTHSGAFAQWIYVRDLWRVFWSAPDWRARGQLLWARPGWVPPGGSRPEVTLARPDATFSAGLRAYVTLQFGVTLILAVFVLWLRARHGLAIQVLLAALVLASLASLGALLDGRPRARLREGVRLVISAGLALWLATAPGYEWVGVALCAVSVLGLGGLALARLGPPAAPAGLAGLQRPGSP